MDQGPKHVAYMKITQSCRTVFDCLFNDQEIDLTVFKWQNLGLQLQFSKI
jgi:hypothetical protein